MTRMYGINIDETDAPTGYGKEITGFLTIIARNPVGRVVLSAINMAQGTNRTDMTIKHYSVGMSAAAGKCNNRQETHNTRDGLSDGMRPFKYKYDNFLTPDDERFRRVDGPSDEVLGRGKGSNVTVHATPYELRSFRCERVGPGSAFDEGLFHEMTHGLRAMQGLSYSYPTEDGAEKYDNEEEFLAIVATNVYISAKGGKRFRRNHDAYSVLQPPYDTSAGFLKSPGALKVMSIHRLVWPTFRMLAQVPDSLAPFNPFRELKQNLARFE